MRFIEPQHTLCWTAWHIFDRLFSAKYQAGKLTMNEYCQLINTAMARREAHIAANRKWYQFRLRWKDRMFLRSCMRLKATLEPKAAAKPRSLKDINFSVQVSPPKKPVKVTKSPELQLQEFMRSHPAFNEQKDSQGKRFVYQDNGIDVAYIWFKYGLNGWNLLFYNKSTNGERIPIDTIENLKSVLNIDRKPVPS